jgi:hypothetical protein
LYQQPAQQSLLTPTSFQTDVCPLPLLLLLLRARARACKWVPKHSFSSDDYPDPRYDIFSDDPLGDLAENWDWDDLDDSFIMENVDQLFDPDYWSR